MLRCRTWKQPNQPPHNEHRPQRICPQCRPGTRYARHIMTGIRSVDSQSITAESSAWASGRPGRRFRHVSGRRVVVRARIEGRTSGQIDDRGGRGAPRGAPIPAPLGGWPAVRIDDGGRHHGSVDYHGGGGSGGKIVDWWRGGLVWVGCRRFLGAPSGGRHVCGGQRAGAANVSECGGKRSATPLKPVSANS